jgi:S1-C subfamily serine protease
MKRLVPVFRTLLFVWSSLICTLNAHAQASTTIPNSVNAGPTLDAAGPEQRRSLNAIYLIFCPGVGTGSGFLLDNGVIVTNVHVVATCTKDNLVAVGAKNQQVTFSKIIPDERRDLALLIPVERLTHGLKLASNDRPEPGTGVNGTSPLLSVGYVAGYREQAGSSGKGVKHIIVNGAFNHGNSGGPLLVSQRDEVIGVVELTYTFYPPEVKQIIDGLSKQGSGFMIAERDLPDGTKQHISEAQVTAMVLQEFYDKTQVMIGEAIAGSELAAMIKEKSADLVAANLKP